MSKQEVSYVCTLTDQPHGESCNFWYWAEDNPIRVPNVDGFCYTHGKDTDADRERIDLPPM